MIPEFRFIIENYLCDAEYYSPEKIGFYSCGRKWTLGERFELYGLVWKITSANDTGFDIWECFAEVENQENNRVDKCKPDCLQKTNVDKTTKIYQYVGNHKKKPLEADNSEGSVSYHP